jgi:hypothetical protein
MSEIEALLELYGALDRAVEADQVDSATLAPLLSAYQDGAATGWYENQYRPWLAGAKERAVLRERAERGAEITAKPAEERPEPEADVAAELRDVPPRPADTEVALSPEAGDILVALSAFDRLPTEGRGAARRLLAVTAVARALPQHFGPNGSHAGAARRALAFDDTGNAADADLVEGRAGQLHGRLAEQFNTMQDWSQTVRSAVDDGLLPESFRSQQAAPPCAGRLIMRPDPITGDLDPCTVLEAEFTTDAATFADVKRYLEPANWQFPGSLWCRMERDPDNSLLGPDGVTTWVYHETVSTSCGSPSAAWTVSTDLQFWFSHPTATEARVEYDLAPGLPTPYSDIEIDEGSLRVIELPNGHVRVVTTKRVRFAGAFDGAGLAMFMCAIGYSTILQDMVLSVADKPIGSTQPFPVAAPQGGFMSPDANQGAKGTSNTSANAKSNPDPASGEPESLQDLAAEAGKLFASYLKDYADICTKSMASIQAGTYKVEDVWADGITLWTKYASGMGTALDLGSRTARAAAKKPPPTGGTPAPDGS